MAFSEFEIKRFEKITGQFIEKRRPPIQIRNEVDLSFRVKNYSIEIFEIRSILNKPDKKVEVPIAKTTYVKKDNIWKIYWQRADLKWHSYEPAPEVDSVEDFLFIVDEDENGCFWG